MDATVDLGKDLLGYEDWGDSCGLAKGSLSFFCFETSSWIELLISLHEQRSREFIYTSSTPKPSPQHIL